MSPWSLRKGSASIAPPAPIDRHRLAGDQPVVVQDRRIGAAGRRHESSSRSAIVAPAMSPRRHRRRSAAAYAGRAPRRSSMPWVWSAWSWVIEHAVEPCRRRRRAAARAGPARCRPAPRVASGRSCCSTRIEQRRRRLRGLSGSHAPQPSAGRGTPPDEPQPRMVTVRLMPVIAARPRHLREQAEEIVRGLRARSRRRSTPAYRPEPSRSQPHRPARCACRGTCRARDRARRSRPGGAPPASRRRSSRSVLGPLEGQDAGEGDVEPELDAAQRQIAAAGEAMQDGREGALPHLLGRGCSPCRRRPRGYG